MEDRFNEFEDENKFDNENSFGNETRTENSFTKQNTSFENSVPPIIQQKDLPNAVGALVLGIVSIVGTFCYGMGFIAGIVGLILAITAGKEAEKNPGLYTEKSIKNAKTGKILSLIGLGIVVFLILIFVVIAIANPNSF